MKKYPEPYFPQNMLYSLLPLDALFPLKMTTAPEMDFLNFFKKYGFFWKNDKTFNI